MKASLTISRHAMSLKPLAELLQQCLYFASWFPTSDHPLYVPFFEFAFAE